MGSSNAARARSWCGPADAHRRPGGGLVVNHRRESYAQRSSGRPGVTAGPWRLGRQPVYDPEPTRWERASMTWSALVLAGRVEGWVAWDDVRYDVSGWQAYLDHTWGRFRDHDGAWDHWDRAVSHRGRGESWLLQGLETRPGGGVLDPRPDDRRWRGVLVHVTPRSITSCRPTIRRSGWWYVLAGATNPNVGRGDLQRTDDRVPPLERCLPPAHAGRPERLHRAPDRLQPPAAEARAAALMPPPSRPPSHCATSRRCGRTAR